MEPIVFEAEAWRWEARDSRVFVGLPPEVGDEVRVAGGPPTGFGAVRVEAVVGTTTWRTSVFPDASRGSYVLPLGQRVRTAEGIEAGDVVRCEVRVL